MSEEFSKEFEPMENYLTEIQEIKNSTQSMGGISDQC